MKNYKEMADAVFRRRDEYAAEQKRKKKIALNASLSLCAVCLAVTGAFGIWKTGVLEPDPSVIGTKPPSITESTEPSMHVLSSNATSEGEYSENTEVISGNKTTDPTGGDSTSPEASVTATDPVETPAKPTNPTQKPTLPNSPQRPTLPIIIPTLPLVTEPVETQPDVTGSLDGAVSATCGSDSSSDVEYDTPQTNKPTTPSIEVPPTSGDVKPVQPTMAPPTDATEAVPATTAAWDEPSWGDEEVPATEAPCCTEPAEPTDPSEPTWARPDEAPEATMPSTEYLTVFGKVVDESGNGIKGAKVQLYNGSTLVATCTTASNGSYTFDYIEYSTALKIKLSSVPSAYNLNSKTVYVTQSSGSDFTFTCTKK